MKMNHKFEARIDSVPLYGPNTRINKEEQMRASVQLHSKLPNHLNYIGCVMDWSLEGLRKYGTKTFAVIKPRKTVTRFAPEELIDIITMKKNGYKREKIAIKYKCHPTTISQVLKENEDLNGI